MLIKLFQGIEKNEGMKRQSEITQQMTMETQVAW